MPLKATKSFLFFLCGSILGLSYVFPGTFVGAMSAWIFVFFFAALVNRCCNPENSKAPHPISFFLLGIGLFLTVFHWLPQVIGAYGEFNPLLAAVLFMLFVAFSSLQFIIVAFAYKTLRRTALNRYLLALPSAWLMGELLMPKLVPWYLGHSQIAFALFAQTADLFGVPLISWLMIWWAELCYAIFHAKNISSIDNRSGESKKRTILLTISLTIVLAYGSIRAASISAQIAAATPLVVGLVQPNLDVKNDFKPELLATVLNKYQQLSTPLLSTPIDLLIWPESSVWNTFDSTQKTVSRGSSADPFPALATNLLFGGQSSPPQSPGEKPKLYNSAFLLNRSGELGQYHKRLLFPFTEIMPGERWLPILGRLDRKDYRVVAGAADQSPLKIVTGDALNRQTVNIGAAICYEDMWSEPLRRMVATGSADLLVGLSNDAWFLHSRAAEQHHLLAMWRSIELRRYLIRSTVDGVSAIIDPLGKTDLELPQFETTAVVSNMARPLKSAAPFILWGEWPLKLVAFALLLVCGNRWKKDRRKNKKSR